MVILTLHVWDKLWQGVERLQKAWSAARISIFHVFLYKAVVCISVFVTCSDVLLMKTRSEDDGKGKQEIALEGCFLCIPMCRMI